MRRSNIKVGEYVVGKAHNNVFLVADEDIAVNVQIFAKHHRQPRISDLSVGDVFEYMGFELTFILVRNGTWIACDDFERPHQFKDANTKVKIISLAAEKKEPQAKRDPLGDLKDAERVTPIQPAPEKRSATVWVNCYPKGEISPLKSREIADSYAGPNREACIPVTIEWVKGQGLGE